MMVSAKNIARLMTIGMLVAPIAACEAPFGVNGQPQEQEEVEERQNVQENQDEDEDEDNDSD